MAMKSTPADAALGWVFLGGALLATGIVMGWYMRQLRIESDPVLRAFLSAPLDDEPVTPENEAAIAAAREEMARGEVVSWAEVKRAGRRVPA